jgi:hypothetical protein
MQLFPDCAFAVQVENGVLRAGTTSRAQVRLFAREAIPRAENAFVTLVANAIATYGSGKNRTTRHTEVLRLPYRLPIPAGGLPAGEHIFYVDFPIPGWLPPSFQSYNARFETMILVSLDVDWAIDPSVKVAVDVLPPPQEARATPMLVRSPQGFHDNVTLELAFESTTIVEGMPIRGTVTLRSGAEANFNALLLKVALIASMRFARDDERTVVESFALRLRKSELQVGVPTPFQLDVPVKPSVVGRDNPYMPASSQLIVQLDVPWALVDPSFRVPLHVMPLHSALIPADERLVVATSDRLAKTAKEVALATALVAASPPALVRGQQGFVNLAIFDAPKSGVPAATAVLEFPNLDLGLETADHSLLDSFRRTSNYLPESFANAGQVRAKYISQLGEVAVRALVEQMLLEVDPRTDLSINDSALRLSRNLPSDDTAGFIWFARQVLAQVGRVNQAIANLPWPVAIDADTQARWRQCAVAERAQLYVHLPAILGVSRPQRVAFGEPRQFTLHLRTEWHEAEPRTLLDLYFPDSPLRMDAERALQSAPLVEFRRLLPELHLEATTHIHALCKGITRDPAVLLAAAESLIAWVLVQRGEQVTQSAYR